MKRLIEIFYELSTKPRCSGDTKKAFEYILSFAKGGFEARSDEAGNILIRSTSPKIAFQAHYDMVCIGENPPVIYEKNGILKAKNGTLGADNGVGVAMMLRMIELGFDAEFLFTSDEEIGLVGANNLALDLMSSALINLDSECDGEITIGCAGGADLFLERKFEYIDIDKSKFSSYEISAINCMGGHSGVDIDKNIISANKAVVEFLASYNAKIFSFVGGERINSISKNATATAWISSDLMPKNSKNISVKKISLELEAIRSDEILDALNALPHGVLRKSSTVQRSANLAFVNIQNKTAKIDLSVRGNSKKDLMEASFDIETVAKRYGFEIRSDSKYPPWEAEKSALSRMVLEVFKNVGVEAELSTIHAGLECAILKAKFPDIQMVSIGPNIHYPHSSGEYAEIASIEKIFNIVKRIYNEI